METDDAADHETATTGEKVDKAGSELKKWLLEYMDVLRERRSAVVHVTDDSQLKKLKEREDKCVVEIVSWIEYLMNEDICCWLANAARLSDRRFDMTKPALGRTRVGELLELLRNEFVPPKGDGRRPNIFLTVGTAFKDRDEWTVQAALVFLADHLLGRQDVGAKAKEGIPFYKGSLVEDGTIVRWTSDYDRKSVLISGSEVFALSEVLSPAAAKEVSKFCDDKVTGKRKLLERDDVDEFRRRFHVSAEGMGKSYFLRVSDREFLVCVGHSRAFLISCDEDQRRLTRAGVQFVQRQIAKRFEKAVREGYSTREFDSVVQKLLGVKLSNEDNHNRLSSRPERIDVRDTLAELGLDEFKRYIEKAGNINVQNLMKICETLIRDPAASIKVVLEALEALEAKKWTLQTLWRYAPAYFPWIKLQDRGRKDRLVLSHLVHGRREVILPPALVTR